MTDESFGNISSIQAHLLKKHAGTKTLACPDGFVCPKTGIRFPQLYRATYPELELHPSLGTPRLTGNSFIRFQLDAKPAYDYTGLPGDGEVIMQSIPHLAGEDKCWLEVFAFGSSVEASGFLRCAASLLTDIDLYSIAESAQGHYGLLVRRDRPHLNGLIVYRTREAKHVEIFQREVDCEYTHVLSADGQLIDGAILENI